MAKIVCIDSEYDDASKAVAHWRTQKLYPALKAKGHALDILSKNLAERKYFQQSLSDKDVTFLIGSGHGKFDELQGTSSGAVIAIGEYDAKEVAGRIIHFLSCNTAFRLGPDVLGNGCKAFFGYDIVFSFQEDFMDEFMMPDEALDLALQAGKTAAEAYDAAVKKYNEVIETLEDANAPIQAISDMEVNRDHLCSPVKSPRWGNPKATI